MNLNEILGKNVTYDNFTKISHKNPGFRPLFRKHIFGGGWIGEIGGWMSIINFFFFFFTHQYL